MQSPGQPGLHSESLFQKPQKSGNSSAATLEEEEKGRRNGEAETQPGRGGGTAGGAQSPAPARVRRRSEQATPPLQPRRIRSPGRAGPCVASLPGDAAQVISPERKQN